MKTLDLKVTSLPEEPRLDKVIPHLSSDISRGRARKLVEAGAVYLNQKRCRTNAREVKMGDKIRLVLTEKEEDELPELDESHILFENQDWIVVNKPAGLPTHETIDSSRFHLVLALQQFLGKRDKRAPAQVYLGIHHRLDRDTSGALLFTKRKEANAAVAQAFQDRTVEKTYLAICQGGLPKPTTLKSFLGTSPKNKRLVASVPRGGKFAETDVQSIDQIKKEGKVFSLIEAKPKTGRTHQIRVHLSENGLPILGDKAYGVPHPQAARVMLHAWKLELLGKTFTAPTPRDFHFLDFAERRD